MPRSLSSPCQCHPSSSLLRPAVPLPLGRAFHFSFSYEAKESNLLVFAALSTSPANPPSRSIAANALSSLQETTGSQLDLAWEKSLPTIREKHGRYFGKCSSGVQIEDLVETVRALTTSRRVEIMDKIENNYGFHLQSISTFNNLLAALVKADEFELALQLSSNLSVFGLTADNWTYSVLVTCYCEKKDPNEARSILDHMLEKGFQPNVATFTTLINSFCKNGRLQKAFEVFEIMGRIGCEPTINTYNCLLKGLCYVGKVEEAYEFLANIKKSPKKPDIYTYTTLMNGFCKVGRSNEASELLDEALEFGLIPNVVTYNTLYNGYFKEGRPLDGIGLLQRMKERHCLPDCVSYSTLLHGLLKWGELRAALQIHEEMVKNGFEADERIMNTLLRGLCRRSRKEEGLLISAYELFERMTSRGCAIYPCAYGLMIEALCRGKEVEKALVLIREMVRIGYIPKITTFMNVLRTLCVEGKLDEAYSVFSLMQSDNRRPVSSSFDILIDELNRRGMLFVERNVQAAAIKRGLIIPQRKSRACFAVTKSMAGRLPDSTNFLNIRGCV